MFIENRIILIRPPHILVVFFVVDLIEASEKSFRERGPYIDIIKKYKSGDLNWMFGSLFVRFVGDIHENLLMSVYWKP